MHLSIGKSIFLFADHLAREGETRDAFICGVVVELRGIEPLAYALRTRRSPS